MKVFIHPSSNTEFNPEEDLMYWKINLPESTFPPEPERVSISHWNLSFSLVFDESGAFVEISSLDRNGQLDKVVKVIPLGVQKNSSRQLHEITGHN